VSGQTQKFIDMFKDEQGREDMAELRKLNFPLRLSQVKQLFILFYFQHLFQQLEKQNKF